MNRHICLRIVMVICLLTSSLQSHAFKIDTHLWIGQQVINDLEDDGMISVKLKGRVVTLPVPVDVKNAILANRNEYLIGNIGPDALPDVVVGQALVHPGNAAGWKTNDWLTFLLAKSQGKPLGTAFTYGYLGHASADIFAHTYVNQYAGDIFELADETLVEQRHVALESFISNYNPPFLNSIGQNLGASWTLVQPSDGMANFVRDVLIYDDQAAAQNASGQYSKHLSAYRNYRNSILKAANDPLWGEIDKAVAQVVAEYFGISVTSEEAGKLVDFLNNDVIPHVQNKVDLTQAQVDKLNSSINKFDTVRFQLLNDKFRRTMEVHSTLAAKLAERAEWEGKLCHKTTEEICGEEGCCRLRAFGRCRLYDPVCYITCRTLETLKCPISEAAGKDAAEKIQTINAELNGAGGLYDQLLQSATQLRDQAMIVRNTGLRLAQSIIDLGQITTSNTSPAKALLTNWSNDLDVAMTAYVKAATNTMINTMNPTASAMRAMLDWWDCYHLALVNPVGIWTCDFRANVGRTWAALENMANIVQDAQMMVPASVAGLPPPDQIRAEVDRLKNEAIQKLKDAAIKELINILPQSVQDIIAVLDEDMTEERLRYYFTKPETTSTKGLLMIADIGQRVKKEMGLTSSNTYALERFPPVYNAVVLAKLALLDNNGLALLAQEAGVSLANDGTALFAGTSNIVANAITSIDGNHQWMPVAPPRPNANGIPYRRAGPGTGYPFPEGYASAAGFVPWKNEARNELFRSLFIGPLSPGIESPGVIGMPEVLPTSYPYRPCKEYSFPNDENDKACIAIKVMPVILQLLEDGP